MESIDTEEHVRYEQGWRIFGGPTGGTQRDLCCDLSNCPSASRSYCDNLSLHNTYPSCILYISK